MIRKKMSRRTGKEKNKITDRKCMIASYHCVVEFSEEEVCETVGVEEN